MCEFAPMKSCQAVEVGAKHAQTARILLEESNLWDKNRRLGKSSEEKLICIPISSSKNPEELNRELSEILPFDFQIVETDLPLSKVAKLITPQEKLENVVTEHLQENGVEQDLVVLRKEIPKSWEQHGNLVLFPRNSFASELWKDLGGEFWPKVAKALSCQRLAQKMDVINDDFRRPSVKLLLGDNGWVDHFDNGIKYSYDVTKCMFSAGNITEKLRIAELDCKDEIVVDLYAGIGYFAIPYLLHAKAAHVHACEWNADAVEALKKNLEQNGVASKATIYEGDNRKVCPKNVADRVNLGLIPSSERGWPVACAALKGTSGGTMHIHENVTSFSKNPENADNCSVYCDNFESSKTFVSAECHPRHVEPPGDNSRHNSKTCDSAPPCGKPTKSLKLAWVKWGEYAQEKVTSLLQDCWGTPWQVEIIHIEHVKSYAPHVDHIVLDLKCTPLMSKYEKSS